MRCFTSGGFARDVGRIAVGDRQALALGTLQLRLERVRPRGRGLVATRPDHDRQRDHDDHADAIQGIHLRISADTGHDVGPPAAASAWSRTRCVTGP